MHCLLCKDSDSTTPLKSWKSAKKNAFLLPVTADVTVFTLHCPTDPVYFLCLCYCSSSLLWEREQKSCPRVFMSLHQTPANAVTVGTAVSRPGWFFIASQMTCNLCVCLWEQRLQFNPPSMENEALLTPTFQTLALPDPYPMKPHSFSCVLEESDEEASCFRGPPTTPEL